MGRAARDPTESRPAAVTTAFWVLIVGAVLLMAGGLMAPPSDSTRCRRARRPSPIAVRNYARLYRGAGTLFASWPQVWPPLTVWRVTVTRDRAGRR